MDKISIGFNAGIIWRLMNEAQCPMNYETLKTKSGLNDMELSSAIGWLAREDKIEIEMECDNPEKCMVFYLNMGCYYY